MNIPKLITGAVCNATFKFNHERGPVLIVNDGALGDYIHGLPFAYCLKNLGYEVTILSAEKNKIDNDFQVIPYYDIINDTRFKMVFLMNYTRPILLNVLKKNVYDFNFTRIRKRVMRTWKEIHWSDFYLETLSNWVKKSIFFNNGNRVEKENYIVFHPGSSDARKNWDIDNFITVYNNIDYPNKIFVLGPADLYLEEKLKRANCNYMISTDFKMLEKLAKETYLFIGSDSGVAHFFSTFNCRMISIFSIGCGETHFPYTRKAVFYYDKDVFKRFYKNNEITQIKLTPIELLKQVVHIANKDNKLEPGFYRSADLSRYLI